MKSYTKEIITREALADIIVRPLSLDSNKEILSRKVIKVSQFQKTKLIKAAKKVNLDVVCFGNNFAIRHMIN